MKIAMLFPYAPAYRGPIYELMDREFDVDWYFCGNAKRPLKLYDYSKLQKCDLSLKEEKIIGPFVKFTGIERIPLSNYEYIICPLGIRNISLWWLTSSKIKKEYGAKILFWAHGWYGRENRIQTWIKKKFLKRFDGMLIYGEYAQKFLLQLGVNKSIIHVIYNSLNYDAQLVLRNSQLQSEIYQNHFGNNNHNIVFIGRLTNEKRCYFENWLCLTLLNKGICLNITFIGDGEERESMEQMVRERGIEEYVWFYGACYDERQNAEMIYNADICVSPGNIGLTAIHSLMFGCPAITHNDFTHQGPEFEAIKEGKTGSFFQVNNSESLADCIESWLAIHSNDREVIRNNCFNEIDDKWNTHYQIRVLKAVFNQTN